MQIFTETLVNTNNILMVFHLVRFINELLASFVEDDKMMKFKRELKQNRYEIILETVRARIEDKWYRLDYCTFEYVQRRIFEYKERAKGDPAKERELLQAIYSTRKPDRMSMAMTESIVSQYADQDELDENPESKG